MIPSGCKGSSSQNAYVILENAFNFSDSGSKHNLVLHPNVPYPPSLRSLSPVPQATHSVPLILQRPVPYAEEILSAWGLPLTASRLFPSQCTSQQTDWCESIDILLLCL